VARPRGLIVLKGAGNINKVVREFIDNELEIRAEIAGLEMQRDGTATTSDNSLAEIKDVADEDPAVPLGPDSVGTLSFTSGSTGIPKGVRGRHYSLTHFFPWMGERFGIGESSKFTMLSGIAHDPIQRDSKLFRRNHLRIQMLTSLQCSLPSSLAHSCMFPQPMISELQGA
jgi:L-aminoadipate-semialdehyde dehydrogenase